MEILFLLEQEMVKEKLLLITRPLDELLRNVLKEI
jgi:hypothetical protein